MVPFPINTRPNVKDDAPIPPHETFKIPELMLDAFNDVNPAPEPMCVPVIEPATSRVVVGLLVPIPNLLFC